MKWQIENQNIYLLQNKVPDGILTVVFSLESEYREVDFFHISLGSSSSGIGFGVNTTC